MHPESDDERDPILTFDWTERYSPSLATVEAMAALRDRPAVGLPPMYEDVDVESLDSLLAHLHDRNVEGRVTFEYHGHRVILAANGDGWVYETVGSG